MRQGNHAMEVLISEVPKLECRERILEVKLFGGSNFKEGGLMVGQTNADFAFRYLEAEGSRAKSSAASTGGEFVMLGGRRIASRAQSDRSAGCDAEVQGFYRFYL